jgi:hypothetical protein
MMFYWARLPLRSNEEVKTLEAVTPDQKKQENCSSDITQQQALKSMILRFDRDENSSKAASRTSEERQRQSIAATESDSSS